MLKLMQIIKIFFMRLEISYNLRINVFFLLQSYKICDFLELWFYMILFYSVWFAVSV